MEGWLNKKSVGGLQTWKSRWFTLKGGSIIYYKKQGGKVQGTISVKGMTISEGDKGDKKYIIRLTSDGKTRELAARTEKEQQNWLEAFRNASTQDPIAPEKKKEKKGALYSIESAAVGSAIGKNVLKKVVDPSVWEMFDSLSSVIASTKDEATAATFHEDVLKIIGKTAILYQQKQLDDAEIEKLEKIAKKASTCVIDYYQMPSIFNAEYTIGILQDSQKSLEALLQPKLTPKNFERILRTITLFSDEKLVADLFNKKKRKELVEIDYILQKQVVQVHQ
eukprot:TRINITY_DN15220_c0_g1_i1.p1 TRINITY_DN15220_c0_g1~~TRINITY_DN15220_c0_g1_i1.p1  ORF type:complete len:279 (-),score=65.94 TRINITY_DN15220_c0_g1_i1:20-856(-)